MDLVFHVDINGGAEEVYRAIATEMGLKSWWTRDTEADEREGGKAAFGFNKRGMVFRMDIVDLSPGERVVWECTGEHPEWKGTRLEWKIAEGMGSERGLWLCHERWKEPTMFSASCTATWGALLYRLKDHVEGRNPGPMWTE